MYCTVHVLYCSCTVQFTTLEYKTVNLYQGYNHILGDTKITLVQIVKAVIIHEAVLRDQAKKMNVESLRSKVNTGENMEIKIAKVSWWKPCQDTIVQ